MEPGRLAAILTLIIYALFCDMRILYIFFAIIGVLGVFHFVTPYKYNSTRRKLMIASWDEPREGIIHAKYEADVTQITEYVKECREKLGIRVTQLHVIMRILADVMENLPDVNGRIVFGKYLPYDQVNVSCLVDIDGGKDLAVALIEDCNKKTIEDIAEKLTERASKIKSHQDDLHKNQTSTFKKIPSFLIAFILEFAQILGIDFGFDVKPLSIKKFQFGSVLVTNIGALNVKDAFAPFTPFCRVPMLVSVCETYKRPVVRDDKIVIAPVANINFTIDHRFLDGGRVKKLIGQLDDYFLNPKQFSRMKKDS